MSRDHVSNVAFRWDGCSCSIPQTYFKLQLLQQTVNQPDAGFVVALSVLEYPAFPSHTLPCRPPTTLSMRPETGETSGGGTPATPPGKTLSFPRSSGRYTTVSELHIVCVWIYFTGCTV